LFDETAFLGQLPFTAHQPSFFHPKEGKDNGFAIILSKISSMFFCGIHYKSNQ
jgi:hypothetical protein